MSAKVRSALESASPSLMTAAMRCADEVACKATGFGRRLSTNEARWTAGARIYEYGAAANPEMPPVPVLVHPPALHESGASRIVPFDLSASLGVEGRECTSPNLMASFVRIEVGDSLETRARATSQAFYVIRGSGVSASMDHGKVRWCAGDLFVLPTTRAGVVHECVEAESGGAALYWIHDEPLMEYLGVEPGRKKFEPTLYRREELLARVEEISHSKGHSSNRLGVLLGNAACDQTKTLTHVLWSLLNSIPAQSVQRAHRHNSVALDLCVSAQPGVYTLMGREVDAQGFIVDPIRCEWTPGGVFVTPPGWWHSHHNESDDVAWVLPIQDAGLYTYQRTLDLRFVDDEIALHASGRIRGSAFATSDEEYARMRADAGC